MPGLWKRMEDIFTANSHAKLDQLENPQHMSQQLLRELDEELEALRPRLVHCLATQRKLSQSCSKLQQQIQQHHDNAQTALSAGDEERARQQLSLKLRFEQELQQVHELASQNDRWAAALKQERSELLREREDLCSQARLIQLRSGLGLSDSRTPYAQSMQRRERMERYAQSPQNSLNELLASHTLRREELGSGEDEQAVDAALQGLKAANQKEQN